MVKSVEASCDSDQRIKTRFASILEDASQKLFVKKDAITRLATEATVRTFRFVL
jgi:hypothetical protein